MDGTADMLSHLHRSPPFRLQMEPEGPAFCRVGRAWLPRSGGIHTRDLLTRERSVTTLLTSTVPSAEQGR
jgi:hypothetical protein